MTLKISVEDYTELDEHSYTVFKFQNLEDSLEAIAQEYIKLRTATLVKLDSLIDSLEMDTLQTIDSSYIQKFLKDKCIPELQKANVPPQFSVLRSDFGEIISYMILENEFKTIIGYKPLKDRELINSPGRGFDAIGIETDPLTLVISEVKVSNENKSPPSVIDTTDDSLRNQHLKYLRDLKTTTLAKIADLIRKVDNAEFVKALSEIMLYISFDKSDKIKIVSCCVTVRPQKFYTQNDCGTFKNSPADFNPAKVRFATVCLPDEIEPIIKKWNTILSN